jgi:peptidoglycan-associated lipoprotein
MKEVAMGRWAGVAVAAALVIASFSSSGCATKKKGLGVDDGAGGRLGEESLQGGGVPGGSLDQARSGTLGSGTGPLGDIQFDYDSFELDERARQSLQRHADWLKEHGRTRVEIEGHCDDRGTVEYNLALGSRRATSAKSYLVALGVSAERLTTISYGEELPLCHESTESCWQRNRRAHFVVVNE